MAKGFDLFKKKKNKNVNGCVIRDFMLLNGKHKTIIANAGSQSRIKAIFGSFPLFSVISR